MIRANLFVRACVGALLFGLSLSCGASSVRSDEPQAATAAEAKPQDGQQDGQPAPDAKAGAEAEKPAETPAEKPESEKHDAEAVKGHDDHAAHGDHGSHGGHGHDPHDLSEGDGSPTLTKPDDLKFDLAIYTAVVFFLLLALLGKFAWGPICHALEAREHAIAAQIEEARVNAEKAAESLRQYEARLLAAADEARDLISQARREAEAAKESIVAEAQAAAQRERERAVADITAARDLALREIAQRSVDTAISLAGQIVRRELKPQDHQGIIREVLDTLPSQN